MDFPTFPMCSHRLLAHHLLVQDKPKCLRLLLLRQLAVVGTSSPHPLLQHQRLFRRTPNTRERLQRLNLTMKVSNHLRETTMMTKTMSIKPFPRTNDQDLANKPDLLPKTRPKITKCWILLMWYVTGKGNTKGFTWNLLEPSCDIKCTLIIHWLHIAAAAVRPLHCIDYLRPSHLITVHFRFHCIIATPTIHLTAQSLTNQFLTFCCHSSFFLVSIVTNYFLLFIAHDKPNEIHYTKYSSIDSTNELCFYFVFLFEFCLSTVAVLVYLFSCKISFKINELFYSILSGFLWGYLNFV